MAADPGGNLSLVLFRSAQDALLVDRWLGATGRVRHIAENVSFTMCSSMAVKVAVLSWRAHSWPPSAP